MSDIKAALRDMLGPSVAIGLADPRDQTDDLTEAERALIPRAVPKRRFEFAAGRRAARQALAQLGLPASDILRTPDRAPVWPAGIMGSIAHCDTHCAAILATHQQGVSLGLDIEPATPLAVHLEPEICTRDEIAWLKILPPTQRGLRAKQIFCAKEAFHKAQYPVTGKRLDFQDVTLGFRPEQGLFEVTPYPQAQVQIQEAQGLILATCAWPFLTP